MLRLDGGRPPWELPPRYVATFDSAAVMLRGLARYLRGQDTPALGIGPLGAVIGALLPAVNRLPLQARERLEALTGATEAIPAKKAGMVRAERLSRWVASEYPARRYPAMAIGSSNGAAIHLCAALGIPWLPQTFLLPIRRKGHPDEVLADMEKMEPAAHALLEANPDLQLHHMHDANQDRLMIRFMTYFRVKRLSLGPTYERFLERSLAPGSTIFLFECERTWPCTRRGERYIFQHGAVGGALEEEFLNGSERVAEYLERYGSHRRQWIGPEPDGDYPEAEWGFEPVLREDVERFARERGHRVVRVVFEDPEHMSPLVADLHRHWYRRRGMPADRLLAESFVLLEPWWALRTGSVPFWMVFNMEPSAAWLESYLEQVEPYREILLTLFSHGVECVGLPSIERWKRIVERKGLKRGELIGVTPEKFPRDFAVFTRFHDELTERSARFPMPGPLSMGELFAFLAERGDRYPVRWHA